MNHRKRKNKVKIISVLVLIVLNLSTQYVFSAPWGAGFSDTSEYMMGKVTVGIIFPESDGSIDPNTEDWTQAMKDTVISEIQAGLDWWVVQDARANLSFVYVTTMVTIGYEPISHPMHEESVWINEIMGNMGYTDAFYFNRVICYCNHIRDTNNADWAFVVFVVNSLNDADGRFPDDTVAYAYLGGPFQVMTYDNSGYGIGNMDYVCAHETGHIFYATDEYNGRTEYSGYLNEVDNDSVSTCLMKRFSWVLCENSRRQVGWRDTDKDNIFDILDVPPETTLISYTPDPTSDNTPTYNGKASVSIYPNTNPNSQNKGIGISINTITSAEYRIDGGGWLSVTDGNFNQPAMYFTFTTSIVSDGQHTFEARARDSVNNYDLSPASDTLTIDTSVPGPVLSVSPTSHDFGTTETTYQFTVKNTGGGTLSWDASESLDWLSLSKSSGSLSGGNSENITATVSRAGKSPGTYNGTISFTSNGGNQDVPVSMTVPQTAPVLDPIGNKSVNENTLLTFTVNATDPDGDALTYSASNLPQGASFNTATKTFTWTPAYDQGGIYPNVHFEVSDGIATDSEDITITVNNVNRPPVLNAIGNKSINEGQNLSFTVSGSDPDRDNLTFSASNLPQGAGFDGAAKKFSWIPAYDQAGIYNNVHFEVSDGTATDSEDITITVNNVNRPPVLNAIGNKSIDEGQNLSFTVSGSDLDGDNLTFSASNLPQGASFDSATRIFSWTPTYQQAGVYNNVHFGVSDGTATDSEDITITVNNVNRPPVLIAIGNKSINEGETLSFAVSASDPDGDSLTYSASNLPQGASFDSATKTFSWTPAYDQAGIYHNLHFEVTDGSLSASEDITITVNNVNRAPLLESIGNKSISLNETLTFTVNATDPDADLLTYSVQNLPDGATFQNQTFTWTPTASDVGDHELTFIASDGSLSDSEKIVITVKEDEEITLKIRFNTDRVSRIGTLYISGETNEGAVIKEVKVLDEYNKILDMDMKDNVSITGERYITGIVIVGDIIKKYPLLSGIKIRIKVAKGEKTKEGETGVARIEPYGAGPDRIGVYNNVFNPLKGEKAVIKIDTTEQTHIKINLYDTKGKKIKEIADEEKEPGIHRYYWYGRNSNGNVVGSGLYLVHIEAGDYKKTKKIVVVK